MSDPAPKRRTAAATASSSVVVAAMALILVSSHHRGPQGLWLDFVAGAVAVVALIFAIVALVKWRAESKSSGG